MLGSGAILVPWGAVSLLLILYILITIVRYVWSQLGLHPLVALIAMFAGLKTFGVFGLILGPAIAAVERGSAERNNTTWQPVYALYKTRGILHNYLLGP